MDFTEFEKKLLTFLKENNEKECNDLIENNKKLIQSCLQNSQDSSYSKELINCINIAILENLKEYELVERVLKHEEFKDILTKFRESDIIIRACKIENISALNWLLTMEINPGVRDENGMTALMHAAEHPSLLFVVDYYINLNENRKFAQIVDNNGETVLFHAMDNLKLFTKLLTISEIDVNHKNKNDETIFIYCCREDKTSLASKLILCSECDLNCIDSRGRTGLMYLVENGNTIPLFLLQKSSNFSKTNINYRNKNNETLLSVLVKQFYETWQSKDGKAKKEKLTALVSVLNVLLRLNYDFNEVIDEEGNTIMNFFLMIDDLPSAYYLLEKCNNLDLSIKNHAGINASFLSLFMVEDEMAKLLNLKRLFLYHRTFDNLYVDPNNNNLLIHGLVRDDRNYFYKRCCYLIDNNYIKLLNHTNNKKENAIIVAVKLGHFKYVNRIGKLNLFDLNQQDELGNTPLHYAIKLRDEYAINSLCYHHADKSLKNNQGKSPMDLANDINDQEGKDDKSNILRILENPISPEDYEESLKSSKPLSFKSLFSKKKTTDEKVNDYVKNYQVEQYKKEYEDLLLRPYSSYSSLLKRSQKRWELYFIFDRYGYHLKPEL